MFEVEAEELGGYAGEDAHIEGLSSGMGTLAYTPDLAPIGAGATYYPRDTSGDAAALNYLGYFPDALLKLHVGTTGSQKGDMAANLGAWSPPFRQAVTDFQEANGLGADGWIGPATRTKLGLLVVAKNASSGGLSIPSIPNTIPSIPGVLPSIPSNGGGVQPVAAHSSNLGLYVAGGLAALGIGWLVFRD